MKYLFFLLAFSAFTFAQSVDSKNVQNDKVSCTTEVTVKQLISEDLNFKCKEILDNKPFKIENFKIKFRGNPANLVPGNTLNNSAKELAERLKAGDYVVIFDIENISSDKSKNQYNKSLTVKIVN